MGAGKRPLLTGVEFREISSRRLSERTCARYGYGFADLDGEKVHVAPYYNEAGELVAQKVRTRDKDFLVTGDMSGALLFGQNLCRGGGRRIVVTEGEIDCLSVAQAFGLSWDVVSIPHGAQGAKKAIQRHLEFLESYDEVVLWFDNDDPGRRATEQCVELFTPGKVKIATAAPHKDANDLLKIEGPKKVQEAVWNARAIRPDGVVLGTDCWDVLVTDPPVGPELPWPEVSAKLGGVRPGEMTTITAGTGQGKSSLCRQIAWHMATKHRQMGGYLGLEESLAKTTRYLVGIDMAKAIWLPGVHADPEEMRPSFERVMPYVALFDSWGVSDPDVVLSRLRYMAKGLGARWAVLDHLSIIASGFSAEVDERRALDLAVHKLRALVEETGLHLFLVSHLRRVGNEAHEEGAAVSLNHLRGTQAIAQLSDNVLALERNQQADDDDERAETRIRVLKCRITGDTGPADLVRYNKKTGRFEVCDGGFDDAAP